MQTEQLRRTPLFETHRRLGARMVPFAGWEMPVQYSGVLAEHRAVRAAAGLFDLSHMGEFEIRGEDAPAFLNHSLTNDATLLAVGQAQYTLIPYTDGGIVDDAILYRLPDRWLLVVNASNRLKDLEWLEHQRLGFEGAELRDVSDGCALIAVQGPLSEAILRPHTHADLGGLPPYQALEASVGGASALVARTGYTGEDGFELFVSPGDAPGLWDLLLRAGEPHGLIPAGLGARDTLRLEARMALYGHELSEHTNPYEAGLGWAVKLDKGDFVGREALEREKRLGPARKLVGFELLGRGVPRAEQPILQGGEQVGHVTSGTHSPTLSKPIGLGYVPTRLSKVDTELEVLIRERPVRARVVKTPFYKRQRGESA
jgi:aminomethyltransferase